MTWLSRTPISSPFATPAAVAGPDDGVMRVLTVCTGNICRSAWAHHVLQTRLDDSVGPGRVEVSSAGVAPNQALRVPQELLDLAPDEDLRSRLAAHRPRELQARALTGQNLVLTATAAHRDAVLREAPALLHRSATLLDAGARLDGADVAPGGGASAVKDALRAGRAAGRGLPRAEADLPDPFRGPAEGYGHMVQALEPALSAVVATLVRAIDAPGA